MELIDEIMDKREERYDQFIQKYKEQIDTELKRIFLEKGRSNWSVGVYDDKIRGTLLGNIYHDTELNGGGFNNLLRYVASQGFQAYASYWCGGACVDASGFTIKI